MSHENKEKFREILNDVNELVFNSEIELEYQFESYLLKQKLWEAIKNRYPGIYTNFKRNSATFLVNKSKNFIPPNKKIENIQNQFSDDEAKSTKGEHDEDDSHDWDKANSTNVQTQKICLKPFILILNNIFIK